MSKMSKRERRLQKKLIPLNLFVCILCIVSAVSMFFMPLLKIDLGKIVGSEEVKTFVVEKMGGAAGGSSGSESGDADSGDNNGINVSVIAQAVATPVLGSIKGEITITPKLLSDIAFDDNPGNKLLDMFITGKDGLIEQVVGSLRAVVENLHNNRELVDAVEEVVLNAVVSGIKSGMPEDFANAVDADELKATIKKLDEATTEDEAVQIMTSYVEEVAAKNEETLGGLSDEQKESIENTVRDMYSLTVEYSKDEMGNEAFSVESLICVSVSKLINENTDGESIGSMFVGLLGGQVQGEGAAASASKTILTDGEADSPVESEDEGVEQAPPVEDETPAGSEETTESKGEIYTNYADLFNSFFTDEDMTKLTEEVVNLINTKSDGFVNAINQQKSVIMIVFGVVMFFIGLWVILFLFAFLHMLAKNKRFTMWYVKLFAPYPCILFWLIPTLLGMPAVLSMISSGIPTQVMTLIPVIFAGISSMTWIMGICYLLLWAVSIFWAFPIKHKIRKVRRDYYDYE